MLDYGTALFGALLVGVALLAVTDKRIVPKAIGQTVVSIGILLTIVVVYRLVISIVPV